MKNFEHPLFLITALCLFFPIGLILLILSDHSIKKKVLMAVAGALIFTTLLATAFIGLPKATEISDLELAVTKNQLTVGQSGGFAVYTADKILTDFVATSSNDNIQIHDNVFTAVKEGSAVIKIHAKDLETSFVVTVINGTATDSTVYLSPAGKRYHSSQVHAGKNSVEMSEEEALRSGKTPCKVCYKTKADG